MSITDSLIWKQKFALCFFRSQVFDSISVVISWPRDGDVRCLVIQSGRGSVTHPGLWRPMGPNGSKRAPGGTAPGGRMSGMPLDGSKPERGYPCLNGSTIIPPPPRDLRSGRRRGGI